ncbi:MAG TPA: ATP-binding protein [Streptosporangiaceae bacterium]|nr:ATP-binding protein [Streptosporangiaceae bacterium]
MRRWLASLLPDCPARDDAAVVATELGSNAIRHTASGRGGWFTVEVTWHGPSLRVAVADGGTPDGPRMIDDPAGEHGRGLLMVHGLSLRTGYAVTTAGGWYGRTCPGEMRVPPHGQAGMDMRRPSGTRRMRWHHYPAALTRRSASKLMSCRVL